MPFEAAILAVLTPAVFGSEVFFESTPLELVVGRSDFIAIVRDADPPRKSWTIPIPGHPEAEPFPMSVRRVVADLPLYDPKNRVPWSGTELQIASGSLEMDYGGHVLYAVEGAMESPILDQYDSPFVKAETKPKRWIAMARKCTVAKKVQSLCFTTVDAMELLKNRAALEALIAKTHAKAAPRSVPAGEIAADLDADGTDETLAVAFVDGNRIQVRVTDGKTTHTRVLGPLPGGERRTAELAFLTAKEAGVPLARIHVPRQDAGQGDWTVYIANTPLGPLDVLRHGDWSDSPYYSTVTARFEPNAKRVVLTKKSTNEEEGTTTETVETRQWDGVRFELVP